MFPTWKSNRLTSMQQFLLDLPPEQFLKRSYDEVFAQSNHIRLVNKVIVVLPGTVTEDIILRWQEESLFFLHPNKTFFNKTRKFTLNCLGFHGSGRPLDRYNYRFKQFLFSVGWFSPVSTQVLPSNSDPLLNRKAFILFSVISWFSPVSTQVLHSTSDLLLNRKNISFVQIH